MCTLRLIEPILTVLVQVHYGYHPSGVNLPPFGCLWTDDTTSAMNVRSGICDSIPMYDNDTEEYICAFRRGGYAKRSSGVASHPRVPTPRQWWSSHEYRSSLQMSSSCTSLGRNLTDGTSCPLPQPSSFPNGCRFQTSFSEVVSFRDNM